MSADWVPESEEVRQERARRLDFGLRDKVSDVRQWIDNLDYEAVTKVYLVGILVVACISVLGNFIGKAVVFYLRQRDRPSVRRHHDSPTVNQAKEKEDKSA